MPKEIYKENIKKLDKEIKDIDRKIIKLEKENKDLEKENNRLTRKSAPNKFKFNNKTDSDNYGKISKKMPLGIAGDWCPPMLDGYYYANGQRVEDAFLSGIECSKALVNKFFK